MTATIPDRTTLAGIRVSFHVCPHCLDGRVGKLSCRKCRGTGFQSGQEQRAVQEKAMSFDFTTACATMARNLNKAREDALWRLLRRFLGPDCPSDPLDVLQVLQGRGLSCCILEGQYAVTDHPTEAVIMRGELKIGENINDKEILDREPIPDFRPRVPQNYLRA